MLKFFEKHFALLVSAGLVVGLGLGWILGSDAAGFLQELIAPMIFILLVISVLKVDFSEFIESFRRLKLISFITVLKLLVAPLLVFALAQFLPQEYRNALVLLAASPGAVAAPGLLLLLGGEIALGLVITVVTSLLAPFTMPLIMSYTSGASVEIDAFGMFIFLALMVFGPFLLAYVLRKYSKGFVKKVNKNSSVYATILLFLAIVFAVATFSEDILSNFELSLFSLIYVALLSLFLHFLSVVCFWRSGRGVLITGIVCMAYFNNALSIVLAVEFFDSTTVLVTLFYEFVWALGLIPLQMVFCKKQKAHI